MNKASVRKSWTNRLLFSHLPIQHRLPILICILLLCLIISFGTVSFIGVNRASLEVGGKRLSTLTEQLSSIFENSIKSLLDTTRAIAGNSDIKKCLRSNGSEKNTAALRELQKLRIDTLTPSIQLWDLQKKALLNSTKHGFNIQLNIDEALLQANKSADKSFVGKIYTVGDSMYYPLVSVVSENGNAMGYVVVWRWLTATPKAIDDLSQLMGTDATLYFGNNDGKFWTDMMKPVESPPVNINDLNSILKYKKRQGKQVVAAVRPIKNTRWLVLVEFTQEKVFEAANKFLYWIVVIGVILLVIGISGAWMISRNLTNPLKKLTSATGAIAAGDFTTKVNLKRQDELGDLARSFNAMAEQVQKSQINLENKANDYKLLFENNPMPMWIICPSSLEILDVNEAATRHYGYSREEFLQLNSLNLRPEEEMEKYASHMFNEIREPHDKGVWRHRKKDGTVITVEIMSNEINYQGNRGRIILSNDITDKLEAEAELARHTTYQKKLITETSIKVQERELILIPN